MKYISALLSVFSVALAAPVIEKRATPTVTIAYPAGTIIGSLGTTVETFNGIPFAQPPTGTLRLKPPQPLTEPIGTVTSVLLATACPQMFLTSATSSFPSDVLGILLDTPFFQTVTNAAEDCLTINVQRPIGTTSADKLPVLFYIFGGGFELGFVFLSS